jgi:hypothetical protein
MRTRLANRKYGWGIRLFIWNSALSVLKRTVSQTHSQNFICESNRFYSDFVYKTSTGIRCVAGCKQMREPYKKHVMLRSQVFRDMTLCDRHSVTFVTTWTVNWFVNLVPRNKQILLLTLKFHANIQNVQLKSGPLTTPWIFHAGTTLYYYMCRSWQDCCRRGENRSWPSVSVESVDSECWCLNNAIFYAFMMR